MISSNPASPFITVITLIFSVNSIVIMRSILDSAPSGVTSKRFSTGESGTQSTLALVSELIILSIPEYVRA